MRFRLILVWLNVCLGVLNLVIFVMPPYTQLSWFNLVVGLVLLFLAKRHYEVYLSDKKARESKWKFYEPKE